MDIFAPEHGHLWSEVSFFKNPNRRCSLLSFNLPSSSISINENLGYSWQYLFKCHHHQINLIMICKGRYESDAKELFLFSSAPADFNRVKLEAVPSPFPKHFSESHPFRLQIVLMIWMVSEGTMATSFEHVWETQNDSKPCYISWRIKTRPVRKSEASSWSL